MIRVLCVNTVYTDPNGIAQVIFNLNDNVDHTKIVYDLLSINTPERSYYDRIEKYGGQIYVSYRNASHIIQYVMTLFSLLKKNRYDIIHVHGNSSFLIIEMLVAYFAGCKTRIAHSHNTTSNHPLVHRVLRPIFNLFVNGRLACGKEAGIWLYGNKEFTIINNGISTKKYQFDRSARDRIRRELLIDRDITLVGHVGFFNNQKNHLFLIDCFHNLMKYGKYKLLLLGDGPDRKKIEVKIAELGLNNSVIMPGLVNNIQDYLSAIDIIVMPSLYEGLPLAMIEEQASGLICVASSYITNEVDITGNVLFIPLKDGALNWAEKINNVKVEGNRESQSQNAINSIIEAGYDIKHEASKLLDFYKSYMN